MDRAVTTQERKLQATVEIEVRGEGGWEAEQEGTPKQLKTVTLWDGTQTHALTIKEWSKAKVLKEISGWIGCRVEWAREAGGRWWSGRVYWKYHERTTC